MQTQLTNAKQTDLLTLLAPALLLLLLHTVTNGQYGFHRDELQTLDDARFPAWGYVAYPPLTPMVARLALELFGPSLVGVRLFGSLAEAGVLVLAGLIARELGGGRWAQVVAALAAAIAPLALIQGALLQYVSLDHLWWVLIAYLAVRRLTSGSPRWWLAIGVVIGLGMLTRYTILVCVAGLVGGVLLTPLRRDLASPWLWGGAALALLVALPNLLWQAQHGFVGLEYTAAIHARDVRIGRASGFLPEQLVVGANLFTLPLWLAGLWFTLRDPAGRRFRLLGWMYVIPLALFLVAQGRSYYLAPAYPMLLAAGAVLGERRLAALSARARRLGRGVVWALLALGFAAFAPIGQPVAPIGSGLWRLADSIHDTFREEVGWPELVDAAAAAYHALPPEERATAAILAGNYGEAGAVDLYGPARGLPPSISGVNSHWQRGYGDPPPRTLVLLGFDRADAEQLFQRCELAGHVTNAYGVQNEETRDHLDIFVCRDPREPWPALWPRLRRFG
jgi:4-amino-4-deoxy-L-arabinose transferase-like glycosyltransferase